MFVLGSHVVGTWLVRVIPTPVAYRLVRFGAPIAQFALPGFFHRACANMRQVLGPEARDRQVRQLTRRAFQNYACYMVDMLRMPGMDRSEFFHAIEIQGLQHLDRAVQAGRGVIVVTGHIGSFDMSGAAVAARGIPVNAVVETLQPPAWNARVQRIRETMGVHAIPLESGVREMLTVLRNNEVLGILVDRPLTEGGVQVQFFGRETRVPAGAATLGLRTGAALLPAVLLRHPTGKGYLACLGEPIATRTADGKPAGDPVTLTQRCMHWLEACIRTYPDQWYMFRHMWPASAPGPA